MRDGVAQGRCSRCSHMHERTINRARRHRGPGTSRSPSSLVTRCGAASGPGDHRRRRERREVRSCLGNGSRSHHAHEQADDQEEGEAHTENSQHERRARSTFSALLHRSDCLTHAEQPQLRPARSVPSRLPRQSALTPREWRGCGKR